MTAAGPTVLDRRTLGRATLDRQLLLHRSQLPVLDAVERVAGVADMQAWSGLSGLREIAEGSGASLATFRDQDGRTLYDLPGASLPDPGIPAPVRFLPDYDNALLAHADRSRIATGPYLEYRASSRNGVVPGTVLVDGLTAAAWTTQREKGRAAIIIEPFTRLSRGDAGAVSEEASQLLAFTDPGASYDIQLARR